MGVDVSFGVPLGWLFAADEGERFGEEVVDEGGRDEEFETGAAVRVGEDFGKFVADAFRGDFFQQVGVFLDGSEGHRLDGEAEPGGETDGAEEAECVFLEAVGGGADGAEGFGFDIAKAVDVVDDFAGGGIFEESVDSEVAPVCVFLWGGEGDGVGATSISVGAVGAEGGDLDVMALVFHDDDAEVSADFIGAGEELEDFCRGGGGGDIVVLGLEVEEFVAHTAAGEVGGMAGFGESFCEGCCCGEHCLK